MEKSSDARLYERLKDLPRMGLAFSGGVDSAYLLYAALRSGYAVTPYFVKTAFQPGFELRDARRLAQELGAELREIPFDILGVERVRKNPEDRCYHCKRALLSCVLEAAKEDGYAFVADGSNASDDVDDRPGMRALREMGVCSPLREAGLTKHEIRRLSKEAGLFTWDKPAYACLATRIPTGMEITPKNLSLTELAEDALAQMGFRDFRVRLYGNAARLQVSREQMPKLLAHRDEVCRALGDYEAVFLDLKARDA